MMQMLGGWQKSTWRHGIALALIFVGWFGISACRDYIKEAKRKPFPHAHHPLLACNTCHTADAQGQMKLTVTVKQCRFCHTEAPPHQPAWLAFVSQINGPSGGSASPRPIFFSHTTHAARIKGYGTAQGCGTCHGDVTSRKGGVRTPTMATCLSCHNHQKDYDEMNCKRCHQDLRQYPLKPLSDYHHGPDFARNHKRFAVGRVDLCVTCHDQPFCARCHDPNLPGKPSLRFPTDVIQGFIHRGDYISRHGREARLQPSLCNRCHGESRCVTCHQNSRRSVLQGGRTSPHPAGYVRRGGQAFHGRDARRDPSQCQSCHDQGAKSNCVNCHKVGGIGGTPHPPGWRINNSRFQATQNGMCRVCHGGGR
ncbi:MAG: hypothetical protein H6728_02005 [Myxococcales bacterium]|nr:hypothetical protein [Myxococcales bacterium]